MNHNETKYVTSFKLFTPSNPEFGTVLCNVTDYSNK